ncbi:MAG TPA: LLM class flavin-dependent oxidoreductase [Acidimicrobiales bacterium]|nr:LLM class flavin-dependent oxidoreductase [Acidimicrobiales bacterium]
MGRPEIGIRAPHGLFSAGPDAISRFSGAVEAQGIDRIWVGDHVSFRGGQGYDGLLQAAVLGALTRRVTVQTAVYLLPLRHPVPVARQVASVAEMAPGRFVFGVGMGGDDEKETANCGVDHARRGRRMDEGLALVRRLLAGEVVDHAGPEFPLSEAAIRPTPAVPVPVAVGGRSGAALARAGRMSDGWLGVFVDADRFGQSCRTVVAAGEEAGRSQVGWQHGMLVWCGFGPSRDAARRSVAPALEELYRMPFERFERYVPCGRPADVAEAVRPYIDAGAAYVLLSPFAEHSYESVAGAAAVKAALTSGR